MKRKKEDLLVGFGFFWFWDGFCCLVFFFIKGKKTIHIWEGKHFHKYNKYLFWSKTKVRCRVFYLNKNNVQNNALNINKSISGQHSKINMNTLIYTFFLAAKGIKLLANVTASQKSCFLGLLLCFTWEKDSMGLENSTTAVQYSPQPIYVKQGLARTCFQYVFWTLIWRTAFTKKIKSGSTRFLMVTSMSLDWPEPLWYWWGGGFSLCSQQFSMLEGEQEDHKPLSNAEVGEASFGHL